MNQASYNGTISKESNEFINTLFSEGRSRSIEVCFSLAYALSNKLILPNTSVDNLTDFYEQNSKSKSDSILDMINCLIVLNIDSIYELTFSLYNFRYDSYVGRSNMLAVNPETAIEDLFGISKYVNKEILECIKKDPIKITSYVNKFYKLISEYEEFNKEPEVPQPSVQDSSIL